MQFRKFQLILFFCIFLSISETYVSFEIDIEGVEHDLVFEDFEFNELAPIENQSIQNIETDSDSLLISNDDIIIDDPLSPVEISDSAESVTVLPIAISDSSMDSDSYSMPDILSLPQFEGTESVSDLLPEENLEGLQHDTVFLVKNGNDDQISNEVNTMESINESDLNLVESNILDDLVISVNKSDFIPIESNLSQVEFDDIPKIADETSHLDSEKLIEHADELSLNTAELSATLSSEQNLIESSTVEDIVEILEESQSLPNIENIVELQEVIPSETREEIKKSDEIIVAVEVEVDIQNDNNSDRNIILNDYDASDNNSIKPPNILQESLSVPSLLTFQQAQAQQQLSIINDNKNNNNKNMKSKNNFISKVISSSEFKILFAGSISNLLAHPILLLGITPTSIPFIKDISNLKILVPDLLQSIPSGAIHFIVMEKLTTFFTNKVKQINIKRREGAANNKKDISLLFPIDVISSLCGTIASILIRTPFLLSVIGYQALLRQALLIDLPIHITTYSLFQVQRRWIQKVTGKKSNIIINFLLSAVSASMAVGLSMKLGLVSGFLTVAITKIIPFFAILYPIYETLIDRQLDEKNS